MVVVSPLAIAASETTPTMEEVMTMRRTEGTFAAELSMLRVPWTAGRTMSFSGSAPCRTIRDRLGSRWMYIAYRGGERTCDM